MSWRTAPPFWCGPPARSPKIKVYILTIGKDETERDENLAKYSQWVATLTK